MCFAVFPYMTDRPEPRSVADQIAAHIGALTPLELASYIGYSRKTIYAKVKKGTIPYMNFDGSIRFDPFTTAAWVRAHSA